MKGLSEKYYLLTEGGFAGYFNLNGKRGNIHSGLSDIYSVYINNSMRIGDLILTLSDLKYTEYEGPTDKNFKRFNKRG